MQLADLQALVAAAREAKDFAPLIRRLGETFADIDALAQSFLSRDANGTPKPLSLDVLDLDFKEVDAAYELIYSTPEVSSAMHGSIFRLCNALSVAPQDAKATPQLRGYVVLLESPGFRETEYADAFRNMTRGVARFSPAVRAHLAKWYSEYPLERLENLVSVVQQYITVRWYMMERLQDVAGAVVLLGILHDANERRAAQDPNARVIPFEAFYNDAVNQELNIKDDYRRWRAKAGFAFAHHSFIFDPAAKSRLLQVDAAYQMAAQIDEVLYASILAGPQSPFLVVRVRRDNLIPDTLAQIQRFDSTAFKKPLKVQFVGEEGVDEGGVQKEFFQLVLQQIFDPKYGMFTYNEESRVFWFNPGTLESSVEFELIGIVLGLAIYNAVILDVRFPPVVYRKLLGHRPRLADLKHLVPTLATGLAHLLQFEGSVKETYMRRFVVDEEVFGERRQVELKPGGAEITLTEENREEYVDLYVQYLLSESIEKQYRAFHSGFHMVVGGTCLQMFRPEELELLICGSPELDFEALEEATHYEDGFTADSRIIKDFWEIVHGMSDAEKKKFLFFCTGSDRVPIKGLGQLEFTISRNGPDSDRLPTAHTCFNHLLLPEYSTREKLRHLLYIAIENSQGFGLR